MKKVSFEAQISRLEEIVELLDRGNSPLEELLNLYREGTTLAKQCRTYLQTAEQQIFLIDRQGNDEINDAIAEEEDF